MSPQTAPLVDEPERRWLLAETDRLIRFAEGALDPTGAFGWLDDAGRLESRPLELYLNARMAHVFGVADALGRPGATRYLAAGLDALSGRFADRANGGWFHLVDDDGPVDTTKAAYGHAFVVLAASTGVARRSPGADLLLAAALRVFEDHFWDEAEGLVRESFSADWSETEPYRGVNSNMHTVEAFLAAADATGDPRWRDRALRITDRVVNGWARGNEWRIPEHFDEHWAPQLSFNREQPADPFRPYGATIGHGMEWARLCLDLDAALAGASPGWLVEASASLYARAAADGWAPDGADGFVYTVDWAGVPVVRERMHWVAAEATAAAAALHRRTGDPRYATDFHTWWTYIRDHLVDEAGGSWHHELSAENGPSATVWSGKPDAYHAVQACLIPLLPLSPSLVLSAPTLADG